MSTGREEREELKRKVNENRMKKEEKPPSEHFDGIQKSYIAIPSAHRSDALSDKQCFQSKTSISKDAPTKNLLEVRCSPEIPNVSSSQTSASDSAGSPSVSFEASCSTDVSGHILTIKPVNFQHPPHEQLPSDPSLYWQLSPEDRSLLGHLSSLYQETVLAVVKEALAQKVADVKELSYKDFLHDIDTSLLSVIKFAKKVEDFVKLSTEDQIAIVKSSASGTLGIRSAALYIVEKNAWVTTSGLLNVQQMLTLFPNYPFHLIKQSCQLCHTLKHIVKNDSTLWSLLHCILMFDPKDDRIVTRYLVNSLRDKYLLLLKHYLESTYSYEYSDYYLTALLDQLQEQRILSLSEKSHLKIIIPIPSPLIAEMIDNLMD